MRRLLILLLVVVLFALLSGDATAQCVMCKAVAEQGQGTFGGEQSIGKGLNRGILFLLAMPYLLLFLLFRRKIVGFFKEFANAQG